MKTPPSFSRIRFFSLVRITSASVLLTAAAAMAFVAVKPSSPLLSKSDSKLNQHRIQLFKNKIAMPGPEREGGPTAGAQEAYANRAYPRSELQHEQVPGMGGSRRRRRWGYD